jgi:hypothetical protein
MKSSDRHDPIELLRAINPASSSALQRELTPSEHLAARDGAIARALSQTAEVARPARRPVTIRRLVPVGAVALVAVGVVAAVITLGGSPVGPSSHPQFAGAAVRVAEANPRLLVGAPGWSVTRADEFEPDRGSMQFSNGTDELEVAWQRPDPKIPQPEFSGPDSYLPELDQWYRITNISCAGPPCRVFERNTEISALDTKTPMNESQLVYDNGRVVHRFMAFLPPINGMAVRLYGGGSTSRDEFLDTVASLYSADVDSWLAALPPRLVDPLERPEVVDEMLRGVPIPPSVDVEALKAEQSAASRYQLGAGVSGAVACGWLDQWAGAIGSGDKQSAQQAVEAMATAPDWPILKEMEHEGGWSQVVWEYAREMQNDNRSQLLGTGGGIRTPDGSVYETGPSYAMGLGCDSETRTLRPGTAGTRDGYGGPPPVPVDAPR